MSIKMKCDILNEQARYSGKRYPLIEGCETVSFMRVCGLERKTD